MNTTEIIIIGLIILGNLLADILAKQRYNELKKNNESLKKDLFELRGLVINNYNKQNKKIIKANELVVGNIPIKKI